jgi:hypothetical protein
MYLLRISAKVEAIFSGDFSLFTSTFVKWEKYRISQEIWNWMSVTKPYDVAKPKMKKRKFHYVIRES